MSRTRRSLSNFVASSGLSAFTLVGGLIVSPLLAGWLGDEAFGAWRALLEALMWLTLLEFGLTGAMQPVFSRALARGRADELSAAVRAAGRGYRRAALLKFVVLAAMIPVIGWMIPVEPAALPDLRLAVAVLLVSVLLGSVGYLRVVIEGRQQSYLVTGLLAVQYLVTTAGALWLAWDGRGVTGQALATVLGAAAFNGGMAFIELRRGVPALGGLRATWSRFRPAAADPDNAAADPDNAAADPDNAAADPDNAAADAENAEAAELERRFAAELRTLNVPVFLRQLGGRAAIYSDSLIVAALLDPAAVTAFYFTRRGCDLVGAQVGMVCSATWAGLGELYHRGDRAAYRARVVEVTKLAATVAVAGLLPAVLLNRSFVLLWAGEARYAGPWVTAASAAAAFLLPITSVWDLSLHTAGHVRVLVPMSLTAAAINLSLSVALTPALGVAGPLLGTVVSYAATAAWYEPLLMRRMLGFKASALYAAALRPLIPGVAVGLIAWRLLPADGATTWLQLFVHGGAIGVAYGLLAWLTVLTRFERTEWKQRAANAFRTLARRRR